MFTNTFYSSVEITGTAQFQVGLEAYKFYQNGYYLSPISLVPEPYPVNFYESLSGTLPYSPPTQSDYQIASPDNAVFNVDIPFDITLSATADYSESNPSLNYLIIKVDDFSGNNNVDYYRSWPTAPCRYGEPCITSLTNGGFNVDPYNSRISIVYDYTPYSDVTVSAVPEPATYALMLAGLAVAGAAARQRRAR
jgi:hypothetical protein